MKLYKFIIFFFFGFSIHAQTVVPSNLRSAFAIDQIAIAGVYAGSNIFGLPASPSQLTRDPYLDSAWSQVKILLYNKEGTISVSGRFDLLNNGLEVKLKEGIRFLASSFVREFYLKGKRYINAKEFKDVKDGFCELLSEGKITLLKRPTIAIKKSDYIVALDMGSKNDKLIKDFTFYYSIESNAVELPKSQRKIQSVLKQLNVLIKGEKQEYKLNEESVLIDLFNEYNSKNRL